MGIASPIAAGTRSLDADALHRGTTRDTAR